MSRPLRYPVGLSGARQSSTSATSKTDAWETHAWKTTNTKRTIYLWTGDIFSSDEWCSDRTPKWAKQSAFDQLGLPEQACVGLISAGLTHELCEPLNALPSTYSAFPDL